MSDDLRLDTDHFGNPNVKLTKRELEEAHDEDVAFNAIPRTLGAISYCTPKELQEIVAEAQAHVDGPTFTGKLVQPSVLDTQVGGGHYKKLGQYQPWQVAAACMTPAELRGYMKGTVLAYLMREADKGGDLDIEKALHTIQLWQEVRKDKPDDK